MQNRHLMSFPPPTPSSERPSWGFVCSLACGGQLRVGNVPPPMLTPPRWWAADLADNPNFHDQFKAEESLKRLMKTPQSKAESTEGRKWKSGFILIYLTLRYDVHEKERTVRLNHLLPTEACSSYVLAPCLMSGGRLIITVIIIVKDLLYSAAVMQIKTTNYMTECRF